MNDFYYQRLAHLDSKAIETIAWANTDELVVKFRKGVYYIYDNVLPEVYDELVAQDLDPNGSAGHYYREEVAGEYSSTKYPALSLYPSLNPVVVDHRINSTIPDLVVVDQLTMQGANNLLTNPDEFEVWYKVNSAAYVYRTLALSEQDALNQFDGLRTALDLPRHVTKVVHNFA